MNVPWITEQQVQEKVSISDAIEAIAGSLTREVDGTARNIPKTMTTWEPASSAHALGAYDEGGGLVAFKTWVNTPEGASALLTLFDATTGTPRAVLEAGALGALRTAAVSGLATRLMSAPDAAELAVIGSGRQALGQVAAVCAVRPIARVRVWSRSESSRIGFAATVRDTLGVDAVTAPTLAEAVDGAPIVTLVTRATEPFLSPGVLSAGTHLNAVGAILPHTAEFDPALLADSDLTVVDSLANARRSSRELTEYYGEDWAPVKTLGDLLTGAVVRPLNPALTIFKGLGMGLADLAVAATVLESTHREGALA
ncbi:MULTISPECIES: ornithine cyclodeaminase family protein [Rhodococcus]|uniref:Ornithine cyclodeaminase family protein n=1 Tax=Rhodococcus oxybenzonivorans TaxID=1990687 RepID=A0AAE4UZI3_9NOCA|nr:MULTISPECIES: ornithine cyclodeaminase family protein [Rhodococcus]MDV7243492.1 ornithine cyclodeaminase family protein [Rhodococcus oxybenzonivorans]MDV7265199.1 ornithine cyclodeaminase family protein [Rhodococcus oxybenzonivorans]MDV7277468.1 ornithine cyclodeaminase family protein [Rhodococcus oxybenzonivorans]MDV7335504.1 ornithine cyclodeaminase family protein [Rhodococcus oxybenzonivorans]MDV7347180.1 ornithine cyclodeaminase family protein [Rhodococcus oxybenzonivorans]